ncbi:hypothetical protein [Ectobacillus polymachus]|uniref:hypothetical protein n=1 Tax=Ectobacillus polymachus TaxID=1508806 RepID=UPI003A880087
MPIKLKRNCIYKRKKRYSFCRNIQKGNVSGMNLSIVSNATTLITKEEKRDK